MQRETYRAEQRSPVPVNAYSDDELCSRATTRAQKLAAVNTVCAYVPEGAGRVVVLAALFAPARPLHHRGNTS